MGRTSAPKGFYTASQAIKKMGLPKSTFYDMVEEGKIQRIVPPNRSDGFYIKAEIDKLAKPYELFVLQYATDTSIFEKATKNDIEDITELSIELFGKNGTANYETRLAQYLANPDIFYVLRHEGLLVGFLGMFPLKQEAVDQIMSGVAESTFRSGLLTPTNILPFAEGKADNVFLIIGVKQNLAKSKWYGFRLLSAGIHALEIMARRGVVVKKLYATSRTPDGIRICKGLGFNQVTPTNEEDDLLRFELDLASATNPLFESFQKLMPQINTTA
jgi:hypothetical protein